MQTESDCERKVIILFERLRSGVGCLRELRGVYDETMAFDFNSLEFFVPNENKTSEILAFLLDPRASHGQGDRFLKEFCEYLTIFSDDAERERWFNKDISVKTEHGTGNGRIDITVKFGDWNFAIGIENKIHETTIDQKNQLKDYNEYLCEKTKGHYVLYYLTPSGHSPNEGSISEKQREELVTCKKLVLISYEKHIIEILERFIMVCKADKVQYFLKEFQGYLKQSYTGVKYMDETKYIKEIITKKDNWEYALLIARDIDAVKEKLLTKVKGELEEYISKRGGDIKLSHFSGYSEIQAKNATLLILEIKKGWEYFLAFDSGSAGGFYEGVESKDQEDESLLKIQKELSWNTYIKNSNVNDWWGDLYHESWSRNINPWLDMVKPEDGRSIFTNKVIKRFEKTEQAVKSITEG